MSAKVSFLQFRAMKESSRGEKSTALITRDLLGGCSSTTLGSRELELDTHVPFGWEKRLDLKSGNVYFQRCDSPTTSSDNNGQLNGAISEQSNQFADMSLDLKLVSSTSSPSSSITNYQSVCTLDKVKSALERAEREEKTKKRSPACSEISYSPSPIRETEFYCDDKSSPLSFATGCPNCLIYVLVSAKNPKCPRCNTVISSMFTIKKKPRIDLNMTI